MTDDLAGRLLAAIEETERIATAATRGPWRVNDAAYPEYLVNDQGETPVAGARWGGEGNIFGGDEDAHHIAHNDPKTVLLRCAADRKIVALHAQDHECPQDVSHGHPALTGWYTEGNCPTLLALAEAYDLSTDDPATED